MPRSLPETGPAPAPASTTSQPPVPSLPPLPAANVAVTASSAQALSPMPYGMPPGSSLAKNDMRNSAVDRRKRK